MADKSVITRTAAASCQVIKDLLKSKEFIDLLNSAVRNAIDKKMNEFLRRLEVTEGDVLDLQSELRKTNKELTDLKSTLSHRENIIDKLENDMNSMEQYSRRSCLRIFGIEEEKGENTDAKVAEMIKDQLNIPIDIQRDIDRSHRVGKVREAALSKTATSTTPAETSSSDEASSGKKTKKEKPRSIIVKFISYRKRREILERRRKLKNTGISIVEDLTIRNQKLLAATRGTEGVISAWSSDGRIIALIPATAGKTMTRLITSERDLANIINK